MRRMAITEANQNFSKVVRAVNNDEGVIIEKNGEAKYVVISIDEYKRINGDVFWTVSEEGELVKIEKSSNFIYIYALLDRGDDKFRYIKYRLPSEALEIVRNGREVYMNLNIAVAEALSMRDAALSLNMNEVDVSPSRLAELKELGNEKLTREAMEVVGLIEERDMAQKEHPDMFYTLIEEWDYPIVSQS